MMDVQQVIEQIESLGAQHAAAIETAEIPFEAAFRAACEQNVCGFYNRCWTCPPDAGTINECIARVTVYPHAVVFQTISALEDSFDIEGMSEAAHRHNQLVIRVQQLGRKLAKKSMALGAGSCGVCPTCTKPSGEPCRYPELAVTSMETCGVDVSSLARKCGLKYINGKDTVTYFGILLYDEA